MTPPPPRLSHTDDVAERLRERFADAEGHHPTGGEVDEIVRLAAESLAHARLREYLPLLIEHQASDMLRTHGFRLVPPDQPAVASSAPR